MKVILNQDVYNLGEEGDVREVARGYARNYLISQGFASLYNKQTVAMFESKKIAIEKRKEEKRQASLSLKEKIQGVEVILRVPSGEKGKLFGSVTNANVAEGLKSLGISMERKKIELPDHSLKMLGTYTARIKLYGNETADLKVIVKSDKEKEAASAAVKKGKEPEKTDKAEKVEAVSETVAVPEKTEEEIDTAVEKQEQ